MKNKKLNTVLFIVVGTVANVVLAIACIGLFLAAASLAARLSGHDMSTVVPFAFMLGLLLSMIAYHRLAKWVIARFGLDDKIEMLLAPRKKKEK